MQNYTIDDARREFKHDYFLQEDGSEWRPGFRHGNRRALPFKECDTWKVGVSYDGGKWDYLLDIEAEPLGLTSIPRSPAMDYEGVTWFADAETATEAARAVVLGVPAEVN